MYNTCTLILDSLMTLKAQHRLHFLRRLRRVNLPQQLFCNFNRSTVESILTSCITVWYGSAPSAERKALQRVEATQLLVQSLVISRLDYCNSLLAGLPLRAIRPLQFVQNAAARLILNLPKFTHVTPLLRSLHWLPVVARIKFKTLMLAYKAKNGSAPPYLMAMVKSRAVPRALRATSTARLEPPSLRTHGRQASRLFSVLAPRWWNELPLGVRTAESLAVFKRRLKTRLFVKHLRGHPAACPVSGHFKARLLDNSLLAGLPLRAIRPLLLVQNAVARLIFHLPTSLHCCVPFT
ncbi:hypothetical protein NFI96_003959 [Prochilodus magdalenae]|nr:hypothetical protein NFI96_003959 [Prochilodus magdalenae]